MSKFPTPPPQMKSNKLDEGCWGTSDFVWLAWTLISFYFKKTGDKHGVHIALNFLSRGLFA